MGSLIKREVAQLIESEFRNSNTEFVSVTGVEMGKDLRTATIYVSVLGSEKKALAMLQKARKFIKHKLSKSLSLKVVPDIKFKLGNQNLQFHSIFVFAIAMIFSTYSYANKIDLGLGYFVPYGELASVLSAGREFRGQISIKDPLFCTVNLIHFKKKHLEFELSHLGLGLSLKLSRVFSVQGGLGLYFADIGYEFDKSTLLFMGITFPVIKNQDVGINLSTFWYSNVPRGLSIISSLSLRLSGDTD